MGIAPEGIDQNPMMYDLVTEMGWRTEINLEEWLAEYLRRRYGSVNEHAHIAWELLKDSAYGHSKQPGPTQSVINQRPTKTGEDKVFNWKSTVLYYDKVKLENACIHLYKAFDELSESDSYLYDLVDTTRQALANKSQDLLDALLKDFSNRDLEHFNQSSKAFIDLILDQDRLLKSRKEFLLGPWLEQAKGQGHTQEEKDLYEFNARTLITTWASAAEDVLHDYANKEWSGLTSDFYLPRWQTYIHTLRTSLETGEAPKVINWFEWEVKWTKKKNTFPTEPEGNIQSIVAEIINKYFLDAKSASDSNHDSLTHQKQIRN